MSVRRLARRLGAVLLGVVAGLLLAELAVRLVAPQHLVTRELRFAALEGPGFRLQPSTLLPGENGGPINALGLRGPELGPPRAGVERVLVLGDSFTYGSGVKGRETFVAYLQEFVGAGAEFVNGGTPSYGTERQARWLEALGDEVAPDAVLLAFFVGNDLTDNLNADDPRVLDGRLVGPDLADAADWQLRLRIALQGSHLWRLVDGHRTRPRPPTEAELAFMNDPDRREKWERTRRQKFLALQLERLLVYQREEEQDATTARAYAETAVALDRVRAWCDARDVPLSVAILPDVLQVDPELLRDVTERLAVEDRARGDVVRPQRFVAGWCADRGVPVVDLLPRIGDLGSVAYLPHDSHFSAEGHFAAAIGIEDAFYPED